MKNTTNNQSVEVAQAMASTTSTTDNLNDQRNTLHHYALSSLFTHGERLTEILQRFSATDYLAQLQEMDFEYKDVLHAIDAGGGVERDPNENPAEVLALLRECYTPTPRMIADRANLLRCMGDLLREVEGLVGVFDHVRRNPTNR